MEPKISTSYRLSAEAKAAVNLLAEAAGLSATAYLEQLIRREAAARPPSWERMDYPVPALSSARRRILALLAAGHSARRPDRAHGWQVAGQSIQSGTLSAMRNVGWIASPDGGRTYIITDAGRAVLANAGQPAEGE